MAIAQGRGASTCRASEGANESTPVGPPGSFRRRLLPALVTILVRRATRADAPAIVRLIHELATFEKLSPPDAAAEGRLAADLGTRYHAFLAEDDRGVAVGYAIFFETYSTFQARPLLYLEDLFVSEAARRRGVARSLLREVAREALTRGCARLAWVVLDWNAGAIEFYEELGARESPWLSYSLEGAALAALAQ